jgi:hypothetical protein
MRASNLQLAAPRPVGAYLAAHMHRRIPSVVRSSLPVHADPPERRTTEDSFLHKIEVCSRVELSEDFVAIFEKEIYLSDIKRLVETSSLTSIVEIFGMVMANIRRPIPVLTKQATQDYSTPISEPRWIHLRLCYEILTTLVTQYPGFKGFDFRFVQDLLLLCHLPDVNERMALAAVMTQWVDTHPLDRTKFTAAVQRQLIFMRDAPLPPYCGTPLLLVSRHLWSHAVFGNPREFLQFMATAIVPLLGFDYMNFFYPVMRDLIVDVVVQCPAFGIGVLAAIQRYWPVSRGAKAAMLGPVALRVATACDRAAFAPHAGRFFRTIGAWLSGTCFLLMKEVLCEMARADSDVLSLFADFPEYVRREIAPALVTVARNNCVMEVREVAVLVYERLIGIEGDETVDVNVEEVPAEDRREKWHSIFTAVGGDLAKVEEVFGRQEVESPMRLLVWAPGISFKWDLRPGVKVTASAPLFLSREDVNLTGT